MEQPVSVNPYEAPTGRVADAPVEGMPPMARRLTRLAAAWVDGFFYLPGLAVALFIFWPPDIQQMDGWGFLLTAYAFCIPVFLVNLYFLHRDAQSLGKKFLGIRIARPDGSRAYLGRIFLLRIVAPGVLGSIPILGVIFGLANMLAIFLPARRCLHDYMAGTVVVQTA
ncbi:MAG: RDD family protein [Candidatus Polarisedimenticolia bacterium]